MFTVVLSLVAGLLLGAIPVLRQPFAAPRVPHAARRRTVPRGAARRARRAPRRAADATPIAGDRRASSDYFATIGVPLVSGRGFDAADAAGTTGAVIVNASLARAYFGAEPILGRRIRPIEGDPQGRWLTIVGVVGDTPTTSLHEGSAAPLMYVPLRGSLWADVPAPHDVTYVLQVAGRPSDYIRRSGGSSRRTTRAWLCRAPNR